MTENKLPKRQDQPSTKTKKAPAKPRQKNLNFKKIQKEHEQLNVYSTYMVNAETKEVIKYYKKFDVLKIQALLTEAYEKLVYVHSHDEIEYFNTDESFTSFIQYLAIKYFTHLGEQFGKTTFEEDVEIMNQLISLGYFKLILTDILDGNEVYKIIEKMKELVEEAAKVIEAEMKAQEEIDIIKENVENKFILKERVVADEDEEVEEEDAEDNEIIFADDEYDEIVETEEAESNGE